MRRPSLAHGCGVVFLLLQLGLVLRARWVDERFFCWAPFDEASRYTTEVELAVRTLKTESVDRRYRYWSAGWENRSVHNFVSMVRQYESTYGRGDRARVRVTYSFNGHSNQVWHWPESR
jgi:hypothetical protein